MVRYGTAGYDRVGKGRWHGTVRYSMVLSGRVRYGAVWCGVLRSVVLGLAGKIL